MTVECSNARVGIGRAIKGHDLPVPVVGSQLLEGRYAQTWDGEIRFSPTVELL
jgi:hypothetical protein